MTKQLILKHIVLACVLAIQTAPAFCQNKKKSKAHSSDTTLIKKAKKTTVQNTANTTVLYFNDQGEWINGFPDKIEKKEVVIKWDLPDTLDRRVLKKLKAAAATVDSVNSSEKVETFMNKHPLLYRLFDNSTAVDYNNNKSDSERIRKSFTAYKNSLIEYKNLLETHKNHSKAKQPADSGNYYFPDMETGYNESFSVMAKNQYGKNIDTPRLNKREFTWKTDTSITFSIYRELRDNQIIAAHYKKSYEKYNHVEWIFEQQKEINTESKELLTEVEKLMTQWEREKKIGETEKAAETLAKLIEKNAAIQIYITKTRKIQELLIQENREWIKSWLWFTNWEPVLNPLELFGFTKDGRMRELKKNIDSSKENINYLTKFIENKNIVKFSNFEDLKKATEQLAGMAASIKEMEAEYGKLEKEKKSFSDSKAALQTEKQLVHAGELYGGNNQKWQPMRFHNYSKGLELINKTKNNQYLWDGDDEKLIAANVPSGVNVSLTEKIEPYIPKSFFSSLIDPVLDEFWKSVDGNLASLQEQALGLQQLKNKANQKASIDTYSEEISKTKLDIKSINSEVVKAEMEKQNINYSIVKKTKELAQKNNEFKKILGEYTAEYNSMKNFDTDNKTLLPALENVFVNDSLLKTHKKFEKFISNDIADKKKQVKEKEKNIEQYKDKQKKLIAKLTTLEKKSDSLKGDDSFISEYEVRSTRIKLNYDSIVVLKKWFSLQANAFPPYDLSTPEDTVLRSLTLQPKEAIAGGNNKDTYTIYKRTGTNKEEKTSAWNFKKYELKRLDAIAGVVFVNTDRSSLIYDAATQTFSSKDIGSSDVMLGIKFFPAGVWLEDKKILGRGPCLKNIIRGTSFINRIAITGGVGVQKSPLRNFFTGFSYDIITGLSVNYGWNFYTKKDYDIKNGAIEKEYESFVRTPYWGITMAPATLLKVLKIINLKP